MKNRIEIFVIEHPSRVGMFQEQADTQVGVTEVIIHPIPAVIRPNPSEGIAQAHCSIIRQAKKEGRQSVVIAEDDCQFFSPGALRHFIDNEPDDFDIYLGGLYAGSEKVTHENRVVNFFCGLHLYMVSSRFYDQFLNCDYYLDSIDNALARLAINGKAKIIACYPFAAVQRELVSNNTGQFFRHRAFFNSKNTLGFPESNNT